MFLCRFASKSQSDWRVDWWDRTRRVGPWSGDQGGLILTRCCCCSPNPCTGCYRRCSQCRAAARHICPRTSRCLVFDHGRACTAGWTRDKGSYNCKHNLTSNSMRKPQLGDVIIKKMGSFSVDGCVDYNGRDLVLKLHLNSNI